MIEEYVTLETLLTDSVAKKHLPKAGYAHAVATAENAFELAIEENVCVDLASKAGLLHDIGHTSWEHQGKWDYESYREFDIHTIKGAERAHELLTLKGEDLGKARDIALAILFHSDSSSVSQNVKLTLLQRLISDADDMDKQEGGEHHRVKIDYTEALQRIRRLDMLIYRHIKYNQDICEECDWSSECKLNH
ncbi:putative domain HDIG-containing protein,VCBS repeat-containing protein [Halobacteroides halobius DSM 5150]|uniref:Putative domain HDIG-containing protein,VCBS repeat-containing protein n=1 Tax=Halobacteroides halobius (strain ATCC 35273 / DSM 5150 / MD-1) TaxID=748449 RepID=L0K972_HALHC|nr:HD domain-containing protein [Halobacteroides halobius]AGB40668.1 putative domain HDIG-containing protein,VCBS repeat-containing protein [Halobacteroides halobius DSM 5150]